MRSAALLVLSLVACGPSGGREDIGRARIIATGTSDTVRFELPVVGQMCAGGAGVLVHGERRGQGLLVWLRGGVQSDTGTYRLSTRGDTAAAWGVRAAVRYMVGDVAHGFTIDDGTATVTSPVPSLGLHVSGRGMETVPAGRGLADLDFDHVRVAADTVSCGVQP